jgi:hypothetical protein
MLTLFGPCLIDLAAPCAGFLTSARLDEVLEALEVTLRPGLHDSKNIAGLFNDPFGLELHLEHDLRLAFAQTVEG